MPYSGAGAAPVAGPALNIVSDGGVTGDGGPTAGAAGVAAAASDIAGAKEVYTVPQQ